MYAYQLPRLIMGGLILELHKARRYFRCKECLGEIKPGDNYYSIFHTGAGLHDIKFPDRIHENCAKSYLEKKKENNSGNGTITS